MYTLLDTVEGEAIEPGTPYSTLEAAMLAAHSGARRHGCYTPIWTAHCYGDDGTKYSDSYWQGVVMRGDEICDTGFVIRVPH